MKQLRALFFLWILTFRVSAQNVDTVYTEKYLTESTRFAWTTLGADIMALPGGNVAYLENGQTLKNTSFGNVLFPRLTIGGIHFWGHADFYVTFPLPLRISSKPDVFEEMRYTEGIETGLKLYPFALKPNSLRPYAGISFKSITYGHQPKNAVYPEGFPVYQRFISPLQLGLTYTTNKYLFTAGIQYLHKRNTAYFIGENTTGDLRFNPVSFQAGFLYYWDADAGARTEKGIQQENIKHHLLAKNNKLSSFYWGVGPSAGFQMSKSPYFKRYKPYFENDVSSGFMPDLTFGYFFSKPDLNIGLSYRTFGARFQAFDTDLRKRRHSVMVESYKFLFNYLGFVPFLGVTGSIEHLSVNVNGTTTQKTQPALGFIFGWDIRVTKTGTSLLRTNLRYIPNLHLVVENEKVMFNHLEFNFIQYVRFIGRNNFYKKYRKS